MHESTGRARDGTPPGMLAQPPRQVAAPPTQALSNRTGAAGLCTSSMALPEPEITGRKTPAADQAARMQPCSVCFARPGTPCVAVPVRDHLARFLDAHANGAISRAAMATVLARIVVIAKWVAVPAACPWCGMDGQSVATPDPGVA
jgi:hypothetical protein